MIVALELALENLFWSGLSLLLCGYVYGHLSRKLAADFQARVGPNRAGPWGIFQPVSDFIKLVSKKSSPPSSEGRLFWPFLGGLWAVTLMVLPITSQSLWWSSGWFVLAPLLLVFVIQIFQLVRALRGTDTEKAVVTFRILAQSLSGFFPALIALFCVALVRGDASWNRPENFLIDGITNPIIFAAFLIFHFGGLVVLGIPPFACFGSGDFSVNYSLGLAHGGGRRETLSSWSQFLLYFVWSSVTVTVFLGNQPFLIGDGSSIFERILDVLWIDLRIILLMCLTLWISKSNPALRSNQSIGFSWRILALSSLGLLLATGLVMMGQGVPV